MSIANQLALYLTMYSIESCERKDGHVHWLGSAECLILSTSCALVADEVRIGAAKTGRTDSLMGIDHDVVLRGLLDGIKIVIDQPQECRRGLAEEQISPRRAW